MTKFIALDQLRNGGHIKYIEEHRHWVPVDGDTVIVFRNSIVGIIRMGFLTSPKTPWWSVLGRDTQLIGTADNGEEAFQVFKGV